MDFIKVLIKSVLEVKNFKEKGVSKMTKKMIAVAVVMAVTLAYTVAPVMAYTVIPTTSVQTITATGTIAGNTVAFAAVVTDTAGAGSGSTVTFTSPSGKTNSGALLNITGGTNLAGARVIIYTDNDLLFTDKANDPRAKYTGTGGTIDPTKDYSGSDGSGMVGAVVKGYIASLYWGASNTPNTPAAYTFAYDTNGNPTNASWVVDKWHKRTYVPVSDATGLDTMSLYQPASNVAESNVANEGTGTYKALYPQYWDVDLYDKPASDTSRKVATAAQALYKNIATVAYSIQAVTTGTDAGYYDCQMPKFSTSDTSDYVTARLGKVSGTNDAFIYLAIGGDFTGLPAQTYSTGNFCVAMVQDG